MKIGIDGRFWNETGVGRYTRNLVQELQKIDKNNEYILFVRRNDVGQAREFISEKKWQVKIADIPWHTFSEQYRYPQILLKEQLDLMHFPYFSLPLFYPRPFIVTIHDLILHHYPTGKASTLPMPFYYAKLFGYKVLMKQSARRAKKVIAVSESTKQEIIDHLQIPAQKISVTYEGIDSRVISSDGKNIYGKYFLHVGNVYPHKNTSLLLEAFEKASFADVSLLVVGKKDFFMERLEKLVRDKRMDGKVLFLGYVDDTKLATLYRHALATVVPSIMEGFGLPVVEAMASRSLVVASDIPSLREVGKNAALYFDPIRAQSLTDVLQAIVNDSSKFTERKDEGQEIARLYSWEKMAKETLAVYESCRSASSR